MKALLKVTLLALSGMGSVYAASSLQDFAINVNGTFTDADLTVANLDATGFDTPTGTGTLVYTFNPGAAGSYFIDFYFDHELHVPFFNEYGTVNGSAPTGTTYQIDNPGSDGNRTGTIFANTQNDSLDNTNHVPGTLSNFNADCGANGGGALNGNCNNDVALAMGFSFDLTDVQQEVITLKIGTTNPGGFSLEQQDPDTPSQVFLSATAVGGTGTGHPTVPEPATWLLLIAGFLTVAALKMHPKGRRHFEAPLGIVVVLLLVAPGNAWAVAPTVKTVPTNPANAAITHDVISGVPAILGGTSNQSGATYTYDWNPGDGGTHCTGNVTDGYVIQCTHTYSGSVGTTFTATLTVTNSATSEHGSNTYKVTIRADNLASRVNIAIDNALWYLHSQMVRGTDAATGTPTGTWTTCSGFSCYGYQAIDGSNTQAFEVSGHLQNGPASDPYTEDVARGLAQVFTYLNTFAVSANQTVTYQGNPLTIGSDKNNNGYGIQNSQYPQHYQSGQLIDAIVASGTPNAIAPTGEIASGSSPGVVGRKYGDIVQDMEDAYIYCQDQATSEGGGWYYSCHGNGDNSASQWSAIGMIAAERGFGTLVDAHAKTWNTNWMAYSQMGDGEFGYQSSSPLWGPFATTPSGMVQLAWDGIGRGDSRWDTAETFYRDNFSSTTTDANTNPKEYFYGMFSFTKAMNLHAPGGVLTPITLLQSKTPGVKPIDWYSAQAPPNGSDETDGVARTLVGYQNPAGYWYGNSYASSQYPLETGWGVIMLRRTVFSACVTNFAGRGTAGTKLQPARVDVTWTKINGASNYSVLRGTANSGPYTAQGTVAGNSFSDRNGLSNGTTYFYVVQPLGQGGAAICQSNQAAIPIPAAH